MSAAFEIQRRMRGLAPPMEGDTIESRIRRAARKAGLTYWAARDLWYARVKDPRTSTVSKIMRAANARAKGVSDAGELERVASRLAEIDADFHGPEIARLRAVADQLRSGG